MLTKHLKKLLPAVLAVCSSTVYSTVLPSMPIAEDFGGKRVTDCGEFILSVGDFTIEAQATAGMPVSLGFGNLSYTPSENGTLRLVNRLGTVYVFENGKFTATLTPRFDYTLGDTNVIKNPGFEDSAEELTSGRWRPAEWETWNGGTPVWGGDVYYVNTRENGSYRSEGAKSIILHSNSRWLSQQLDLTRLKPATYYCISYDYWTSDGNGNGGRTYRLQLGTAVANNSIMDMEAHTTSNVDYAKHTFTAIFRTPDSLSDPMYLSLYRPSDGVDWLDNIRMSEVVTEKRGLSGVTDAVYSAGSWLPMNIQIPEGSYIDYSDRIVNRQFNDGYDKGWTARGNCGQLKTSTGEKGNGFIKGSQNHAQSYSGGATTGRFFQTVGNLPAGRYEVAVDAVTTPYSGAISVFVSNGKTVFDSDAARNYTVSGIIAGNELELGVDIDATSGYTVDFDNFTLHYRGMDAAGYMAMLAGKIAEAEAILTDVDPDYDSKDLNTAVIEAKEMTEASPCSVLADMIMRLESLMTDYNDFVEAKQTAQQKRDHFLGLIEAAKNELTRNYPAVESLRAAIATAEAVDLGTSDLAEAARALNRVREEYYNSQYTEAPQTQTVSSVDLTLANAEKFTLMVDGNPYYPTEIQVRPDKLRGYEGWSEEEIEAAFRQAASDGFNTLSVPLFWSEIEPEKDYFNWEILDTYLNWCHKYGVRMELLWFSWSSGGRVQYLWNRSDRKQLRTPDYVCSIDGKSEFNMLRDQWEYSLDWRDTALREREKFVLGRIMEHVALWDANNGDPHTVIGVQLGNEASTHGANTASDDEIIDWYHNVGQAVKDSKYKTWTRLNCVSWMTSGRTSANERKRNAGGTNIDFVGIDIYGTNADKVKGNMDGQFGENGKNFRMIMEIDAKDSNSPIYQIAALAGDKAFDYYNLGPVDGNGLYDRDGNTLKERSHINLVRQRNKMLNMANAAVASKKQGQSLYVYNYKGNSTNAETGVAGITFKPGASTTQGVSVRMSDDEVILLATDRGVFRIPEELEVKGVYSGSYDRDGVFTAEKELTLSGRELNLDGTCCIRVLTGALDGNLSSMTSKISNPGFENNGLYGWNSQGFWTQTNDSPSDAGWTKEGSVYAERWVSSDNGGHLPDSRISQRISALPNGNYILKASGHSMNQADTEGLASGATLVAGYYSTPLNKGGEYEVQTTVAEGNLEIGCDVRNTDANWVAVDNFRLYYAGDDNADYSDYRTHAVSEVREAIADVEHPVAAYTQALDDAMSAAEKAEGNEAIVSALADMRTAHAEFVESMQAYNKLAGIISTSETFIAGSDYPNKDEYRRAIDAARSVLDGDNTEISAWQQAYDDLKAASQVYLAGRPSEWHEIANGSIWKDMDGNIVQAHAPGFLQVNDTWYMIGEDRTNQWNPDVNMYSSKDLVHWKFERKIIENRVTHPQLGVDRMIERPKLMYCEKTGKYVVWCHWEAGNYGASEAAVFVADQVNGEYRYHWSGRPLGVKSRDCNVFVDTDGTAYFISTIEENQHLGLFKLSDDYLSAVEYTELFKWKSREAPVIVKVNGVYHMLSSACSGWNPNQCQLAYSRSLTSGWSDLKNVGNKISYDTQAAAVLSVAGKTGTSYIYVGDRWQDPALAESKTIMFPISFTDTSCKFGYSKNFEVNFALGQVREAGADERVLDKTGWRVVDFSSEETSGENGRAVNVIDGDLSTRWHTRYSDTRAQAPHFVTVDMGESHTVAGFLCVPRTDNDVNGLVREYVLQTSEDGENWTTVSSSSWLPYWTEVYFPAVSARYFKLTSTKGDYASISEIDILTDKDDTEDLVFRPYSKIGEDDWTMNGDITVPVGSKVALGPQIDGSRYGYGSWSLVKPDGSVNPGREHTLENLQTAHSGRYSYLYLDPSQHTHTFGYNVLVSDSPTSVNGPVSDSKIVVDRRYYTVDGIETAPPASCGVVVVKTVYSDGTVEFSKMMGSAAGVRGAA